MPNMKEEFLGNSRQSRIERQARKHERALEKLGENIESIGRRWLEYLEQKSTSAKPIREEWKEFLPRLARIQKDERPVLIKRLAKGLIPSEDNPNGPRESIPGPFFRYSLGDFQEMSSGVRFDLASMHFIEALSDLSGYYDKERISFIDFMSSRKDLRGSVSLPQTFPAIAEWFVQQSNITKQT